MKKLKKFKTHPTEGLQHPKKRNEKDRDPEDYCEKCEEHWDEHNNGECTLKANEDHDD